MQKTMRLKKGLGLTAVLGSALLAGQGYAQEAYPTKSVNMVVPFAAGGPTDVVARSLAEAMRPHLGQTVVVENVGGAGGTIGTGRIARAKPDGYNILLMHIGFSTAPSLYRKLAHDPIKDFAPIGLTVDVPMTLVARSDFPPNNVKEFVDYVKANHSKLSMANAGIGSASHLCGMIFSSTLGVDLQPIPYSGTAPAMNDLLGKQVDFLCDQTTNTTGQIKSGRIKAYAVTSLTPVSNLPDLPTLDSTAMKGFNVGIWHGLWAPAGTPKAIVDKLQAALQAGLKEPAFQKRMSELGAQVMLDQANPGALDAHVKSEIAKWGEVIKKAGVYAD